MAITPYILASACLTIQHIHHTAFRLNINMKKKQKLDYLGLMNNRPAAAALSQSGLMFVRVAIRSPTRPSNLTSYG
jgi:hypothetical protein